MSAPDMVTFQRLKHWPGEALRSCDFNLGLNLLRHRRWWHNRALHNTYGVVTGLTLPVQSVNGNQWIVAGGLISPGLAYDCFGRELWLRTPLPVPSLPREGDRGENTVLWTLLVRNGSVSPLVHWRVSTSVEITDGIPLA